MYFVRLSIINIYIYYSHTIFFTKSVCVCVVFLVVFGLDMFRLASNKGSLNINPDFSLQATCDLR